MDQEKSFRLLIRQLKDIQAQADKIASRESSQEIIEAFARYSVELKEYIAKNIESQQIRAYLSELPEINYSRTTIKLWQYLIMPSWWISAYNDYRNREQAVQEIRATRGRYATLEILVRELAD